MDNETKQPRFWSERWRLMALEKDQLIPLFLLSVMVGMIFVLFHKQGNTVELAQVGRSAFLWLQFRWAHSEGDFSHGYLIPFVSLGIIWFRREKIAAEERATNWPGLALVALALFTHYVGTKAQQPRLSIMGLILLLWSLPFFFSGWKVARHLIFPCAFLVFCIPMTFLDALTFPLRMFVSMATEVILNGLGIGVVRDGSVIQAVSGAFKFNIEDPCSGLRSLLALTAITAVYANLTQRTLFRQWLLFLCSVPIAVIGNMARILTIGLVAQTFGQKVGTGLYHDYSGYIFFPVAIGLMLGVGSLINLNYRELWKKFKTALHAVDSTSTHAGET